MQCAMGGFVAAAKLLGECGAGDRRGVRCEGVVGVGRVEGREREELVQRISETERPMQVARNRSAAESRSLQMRSAFASALCEGEGERGAITKEIPRWMKHSYLPRVLAKNPYIGCCQRVD